MNFRQLTPRQREALKITGYVLWGVILTLLFVAIRFPSERITLLAETEISVALKKDVRVNDASVYRLSGLDLAGVDLYSRTGLAQPLLRLNRLRVRLGIISTILGRRDVTVHMEPDAGGHMDARLRASSSQAELTLSFDSMRLAPARFEPKNLDRPPAELEATLIGKIDYLVEPDDGVDLDDVGRTLGLMSEATGSFDITLADLQLINTDIGGFPLPELHFDRVFIKGTIQDQKLSFTEFKGTGPMGDLEIVGSVRLSEPVKQSGLSLQVRYTPDAETRKSLGPIIGLKLKDDGRGTFTGFIIGQIGSPQLNKG